MSSSSGDLGINGNLNVLNTLNSNGLKVNSGTVDFSGAAFVNSSIPSAAINGSSSNASTIAVANDASLTITSGYIPYCGVTNNNVALKTSSLLKYNATNGTITANLNGTANSASTSTTQSTSDNSTNIATTSYVQSNLLNYLTSSLIASTYATISGPTFTGTPKSTTPITSDNSTTIATTEYVKNNLLNYAPLIRNNSYYLTGCNPTTFSVTGSSVINQTMNTPLYPYNTYYVTGTFTNTLNIILPIPSSSFAGFLFILKRVSGTSGTSLIFKTATGSYMVGPGTTPPAVANQYNTAGGQSVNTTFQAVCLLSQTANTYYWYCLTP